MSNPTMYAIVRDPSCDPSVTQPWLAGFAVALAVYLQRDVAADHGLAPPAVDPTVYTSREAVSAGAYALVFQGTLGPGVPSGAEAYHTEDEQGRVFAPIMTTGQSLRDVSVSGSHEGAEAFLNPRVNRWVDRPGTGDQEALEACDRCEEWSYSVNGYDMSDYIVPAAWDPAVKDGTPLDKLGHLTQGGAYRGEASYVSLRGADGTVSTDPPMRLATLKARGCAVLAAARKPTQAPPTTRTGETPTS